MRAVVLILYLYFIFSLGIFYESQSRLVAKTFDVFNELGKY